MNALFSALKADHVKILDLLRELAATSKTDEMLRVTLFSQFKTLLFAHSKSEEHNVYAAIKDSHKINIGQAETEHKLAETLMESLDKQDKSDASWWAKLESLRLALFTHIKEEESLTFHNLEKELTLAQMQDIAQKFQAEKKQLMGNALPRSKGATAPSDTKPVEGKFAA